MFSGLIVVYIILTIKYNYTILLTLVKIYLRIFRNEEGTCKIEILDLMFLGLVVIMYNIALF